MIKKNLNRIPLEQVYNVRSFGGYEVDSAPSATIGTEVDSAPSATIGTEVDSATMVSRHGSFFRSGGVTNPTEKDVDIIINEMKVRTIFDLRGEQECEKAPNYFKDSEIIKVINVDLFVELDDTTIEDLRESHKEESNMALIYVAMMEDSKEKIKYLIDEIASRTKNGAVLYHCSAGKDRAGVTSMFLQAIAGFCKRDIIADYSVSTETLGEHGLHFVHKTKPEYIEFLLNHLENIYGGPVNYLKSIGVKEESFKIIKERLTIPSGEFPTNKERDLTLRRLNLKSIKNFRSIGGFPTVDGGITNHGVYYRSGLPNIINENDLNRIKALNIKTIIDLRSKNEILNHPNGFLEDDFFKVINIDLMEELNPMALLSIKTDEHKDIIDKDFKATEKEIRKALASTENIMGQMYVYLLSEKAGLIKKALNSIAEGFLKGGVLIHCTAGKDRTGTITMLVNMIAGMENRDIIVDYQVSETYLDFGNANFALSRPEYIKMAIDYLENKWGGGQNYLNEIGFSKENFNIIKEKLVSF